jgi:3',5'-cyclic-AMP phosphodiesterase
MRRILVTLAVVSSCTHVAEERTRADERIGHAHTAAIDVDVDDGAACVRSIAPGVIRLRAQTPAPVIRIRANAERVRVTIDNVLADATLSIGTLVEDAGCTKTWDVPLAAGAAIASLHTPDEASRAPYRFALLADVQEDIDRVGDIYARMNADPTIRFVLFSGDLTRRGTEAELLEFERRESELRVPLYATLGNHELGADEVYFQRLFGRGNFHFVFRDVAFTLLDSASATIDPRAFGWLETWLQRGRDLPHVVAMHIPPFDPVGTRNGAFASRAEASKVVAALAEAGVDLTLYGHIHSFYAYENAGIPAYISGGGGAVPERLDGIGRNYLTVDVDPAARRVLGVGVVRID